jgi:hypothetical protein
MQDRQTTDPDQELADRHGAEDGLMRRLGVGSGRVLLAAVVLSELACLAVVAAIVL